MRLKETLARKIEEHRPRTTRLLKEYGGVKVGEVTMAQCIGGVRGVRCLVTDISYLDPNEGIRFRGYTIPETLEALPKVPGGEMPYVEGFLYLLLTGDLPTKEDTEAVAEEFRNVEPKVRVTVGISGTGGGFKRFSVGETDISDASRAIKAEEAETCAAAGIEFIELLPEEKERWRSIAAT